MRPNPWWIVRTLTSGAVMLGVSVSSALAATPVRVTSQPAASNAPAIATGVDGRVRVAWSDTRDGNSEIYFALLDGFGSRMTGDVRVTNTAASSTLPRIGVDGQGNAILCWRESNNVWIAKLDPLGNSVVTPRVINLGFSYVVEMGPDLYVQSDGRFAVGLGAQHSALDDMFVVNFDAGLNKLCQTTNLYTNLTFQGSKVSVRCSGNLSCTLAWQQVGFLDGDNLATVGSAVNCSKSGVSYLCSGSSFSNPDLHGAGLLYVASNHVYRTVSGCGTQLSENPGPSLAPAGDSLSATHSIAVWEDRRSGNSDLYYAVYANVGLVKAGVDSALITGPSASQAPGVATDRNGTAFVAWQDDRDGNAEVYFTRIPDLTAARGELTGVVYDAVTLAPIPNAAVSLIGPQRPPVSQNYVAGTDGRYRIAGLVPGRYAVSASSAGHASPLASGIDVPAGATVTRDLYVSTGSVLEGIVRDAFSHLAIGGARLHLISTDALYVRDTQTDPEGLYRFDLPAGTYDLTVSVPALGIAGPYFSPDHDLYVPESVTGLIVGASPAARDFGLSTRTVVFAHGILSDATSWGPVASPAPGAAIIRSRFETAGYHTEAMSRDWTRSIPDQAIELKRWFSYQPFKSAYVVAHSMGGLAMRWYIEREPVDGGSARVPTLVTLGTPHHGAPAATDVSDFLDQLGIVDLARQAVAYTLDMSRIQFETKLLQQWTFLTDLRPGSANLNALNYGDPSHADRPGRLSCLAHEPEQIPTSTRYVTIDGDSRQWFAPLWAEVPCRSDGVVPVASAKLYKTSTPEQSIQNIRTGCLPDPGGTQDCGCAHMALLGSTDYKNSACVSTQLVTWLTGGTLPTEPNCTTGTQAVSPDTALLRLADLDHLMTPGSSVVDSFLVSNGAYLGARVRWWRGGVRVTLRSPLGTIVDSASTIGNPSRLYASDYANRFVRIDAAGVFGGWWKLTTTLTSDSAQHVSVRPYVSSGMSLDAAVQPARPAPGQSIVATATLNNAGAPLTGATVTAETRDPAGATAVVTLRDDGVTPDTSPGDGVYSGALTPCATAGRYVVTCTASGGNAPGYAPVMARLSIQSAASPQIVVGSSDLVHGPLWAYPSDPIVVGMTVHNVSGGAADSVWVTGREDSTGVAFLDTVVAIPALSSATLASRFSSTRIGLHPLTFTAIALGDVPDPGSSNHATRVTEIVPFGGAPTSVGVGAPPRRPVPTYLPTRVRPNPARGACAVEFYLPRPAARTRLTILDAAGRMVSRLEYGGFSAGWQRATWASRGADGGRVTPGLYFYRLDSDGLVGQGRMVILP